MTAPDRTPQPGDVVLLRATVIPPERPLAGDMLAVSVAGLTSSHEMEIRTGVVHEVLGPPWWPPQQGDVVLDRDGDAWQFHGDVWRCVVRGFVTRTVQDLDVQAGPLTLVARAGRGYDG